MGLQAQLFRAQQNVELRKEGGAEAGDRQVDRTAGVDVAEIFKRQNKGVADRDKR